MILQPHLVSAICLEGSHTGVESREGEFWDPDVRLFWTEIKMMG